MPPRRSTGSFLTFIGIMLLLGAAMTIAVAWGCRWMSQREHGTLDASLWWNGTFDHRGGPSLRPTYKNQDGRQYFLDPPKPHSLTDYPSIDSNGVFEWNDVGVQWCAMDRLRSGAARTSSGHLSSLPLVRPLWFPWWTTVNAETEDDVESVIELAAGWPLPAMWTQHRFPRHDHGSHALIAETRGSVYGYLPFSKDLQQLLYRPLWVGFVFDSIFWGGLVAALLTVPGVVWRLWRCRRRWDRGQCLHCGYTAGIEKWHTCAECGWSRERLDVTRWRRATLIGLVILFPLILAEVLAVASVCANPEVTPLERAAYEGDLKRMRKELAKPGQGIAWHQARIRVEFQRSGRSLITSRGLAGAILGGQVEAIDLLLEGVGGGVPRPDELVSRELLEVVAEARNDPVLLQQLLIRYQILEPARIADDDRRLVQSLVFLPIVFGSTELLPFWRDQMARGPRVKGLIWPGLVEAACRTNSRSLLEDLLDTGPGDLNITRGKDVRSLFPRGLLFYFLNRRPNRDLTPEQWAIEAEKRVDVWRRFVECTRVELVDRPGKWGNMIGSEMIKEAFQLEEPERTAIVAQIVEFGISAAAEPWEVEELWSGGSGEIGSESTERWKWEALINCGADPAICETDANTRSTLEYWVDDDDAIELVRFLLAHGARPTVQLYEIAGDAIRVELDAWLAEQGRDVRE